MKKQLNDNSPMPFGKFKGEEMEDVPAPYLLWLWRENEAKYKAEGGSQCNAGLHSVMCYIEENLQVLQKEVSEGKWQG